MRYNSTQEAHDAHIGGYHTDGFIKHSDEKDNRSVYRINFVVSRVNDGSHVLDVGCNGGTIAVPLKEVKKCRVKGIDIVSSLVDLSKKRGIFAKVGEAEKLEFADGIFDHVICSEVLEHLYEPILAINEAYRVLKPGGSYLVTVPFNEEELGDFHHQRFDVDTLTSIIRNSSFCDSVITMYGIPYGDLYCEINNISKDKAKWIGCEVIKNA